ncbi:MAG: glycosyltransferase family 1 protein [Candidatus Nanohalarchaeota archaeon]|nr:MAG: glycosyltransferase family 1 protein [Candidatus Nanohaloarchaeota archaeon]
MKILQTPVRFKPYIGGVENYVYELSKQLVRQGHEVKVICANEPLSKAQEQIEGVEVNRLKYFGKIANTNITPLLPVKLLSEEFDVIHTHLPTPWSAEWSAVISVLRRKKLVVTYHNDIAGRGISKYIAKFYNMTMLKFIMGRAHKIIITQPKYLDYSPYLKKYNDKIVVIPVGVDTKRFKPMKVKKEPHTVGFLSVLDEYHRYKGLDYLLKAVVPAKEKMPDIKLMIGGSGALLREYKKMAKYLGIEDNVKFLGFIPDKKLVEFYNKLDVFVLPSTSSEQEGFGIVALEALACGTPVIMTDIMGISREIKKNSAGIVIKPKDERELAKMLVKLLSKKSKTIRDISNPALKYSWCNISTKIHDVYG